MTEIIQSDSVKLGWKSRKLDEFTICPACGFYRAAEQETCNTNGCSKNPNSRKHKRGKAN